MLDSPLRLWAASHKASADSKLPLDSNDTENNKLAMQTLCKRTRPRGGRGKVWKTGEKAPSGTRGVGVKEFSKVSLGQVILYHSVPWTALAALNENSSF
jgi:hypothetical protein